jgi:hypothetical protein
MFLTGLYHALRAAGLSIPDFSLKIPRLFTLAFDKHGIIK